MTRRRLGRCPSARLRPVFLLIARRCRTWTIRPARAAQLDRTLNRLMTPGIIRRLWPHRFKAST